MPYESGRKLNSIRPVIPDEIPPWNGDRDIWSRTTDNTGPWMD